MDTKKIIGQLAINEQMVIIACLHHCATLPKEERKRFIADYGEKTDRELTQLIKKLSAKNS